MLDSLPPGSLFPRIASRFRSLKFALLLVTGGLAAFLVAEFVSHGIEAWEIYHDAQRLKATTALGDRLIEGTYDLVRERLATNDALQASGPVSAEARGRILSWRKAAQDKMDANIQSILADALPNRALKIAEVQKAHEKANEFRKRADEMLALPKARRDRELLNDYIPTMTAWVNAALKVWVNTLQTTSSSDPRFSRYSRIKRLSWRMREISGLERSIIAAATSRGDWPIRLPSGMAQLA